MSSITIGSVTIGGWHYLTTTVELRVFLQGNTMRASDGTIVTPGSPTYGFYQTFSCSISGSNLTIATGALQSTTDSDTTSVRYGAYFFDTTTKSLIQAYDGFTNFQLPSTPTSTTWAAILTYNRAQQPQPISAATYTKDQINALLSAVKDNCRLVNTNTISNFPNNAPTVIPFSAAASINGITFNGTDTATINTTGYYTLTAMLPFTANGAGARAAQILLNGSTIITQSHGPASPATATVLSCAATGYRLSASDTITLLGFQTSGGVINIIPTVQLCIQLET